MVDHYVDFYYGKNSNGGHGPSPNAATSGQRPVKSLHYICGSSVGILPGDTIYVSGGQTWLRAGYLGGTKASGDSLLFLMDGRNNGGYIKVVGGYPNGINQDQVTINFSGTTAGASLQDDQYWEFRNIKFKRNSRGSSTYGLFRAGNTNVGIGLRMHQCTFTGNRIATYSTGLFLSNYADVFISGCRFYGNWIVAGSTYGGIFIQNTTRCLLKDCVFSSNYQQGAYLTNCLVDFHNCYFHNGPGPGTLYGIRLEGGAFCNVFNSTSNCNTGPYVYNSSYCEANSIGCNFSKFPVFANISSSATGKITLQDCKILGSSIPDMSISVMGTIRKNTTNYYGVNTSMHISSNCRYISWYYPYILPAYDPYIGDGAFKLYCSQSATPRTVTCNIYVSGSLGMNLGLPKPSSLYIQTRYRDPTTGKYELTSKSTEYPAANAWISLTNTIPANVQGFIYTNLFLHRAVPSAGNRYGQNKGLYVDPKPILL